MGTISKKQLGGETLALKKLYAKFGVRVSPAMQQALTKKGYTLCDLGTSKKCYTRSGAIGKKHLAGDKGNYYFGIGVCNRGVRMKSGISVIIYRAWIKKIV